MFFITFVRFARFIRSCALFGFFRGRLQPGTSFFRRRINKYFLRAKRIGKICRPVEDVCIETGIPAGEPDRVLRHEPLEGGAVVPGAKEVQPGAIVLAAGELVGVAVGGAGDRHIAERFVGVLGLEGSARIGQRERAAQDICQEAARAAGIRAAEELIDIQPRQQVCGCDVA